jgi:hypothetical protein
MPKLCTIVYRDSQIDIWNLNPDIIYEDDNVRWDDERLVFVAESKETLDFYEEIDERFDDSDSKGAIIMTMYGALLKINEYQSDIEYAGWALDALRRKVLRAHTDWLKSFAKADMDKLVAYMVKGCKSTDGLIASAERYVKRYCK